MTGCPLDEFEKMLPVNELMPETVLQVKAILTELRSVDVALAAGELGLADLARQHSPLFRALPPGRQGFIASVLTTPVSVLRGGGA